MILVTGATGNVGREVVNLLLSGGEKMVAVTRNPAKAALPCSAVLARRSGPGRTCSRAGAPVASTTFWSSSSTGVWSLTRSYGSPWSASRS